MLTLDHEEVTIDVEEVKLNADHTAALKTISQGQLAQRYTGPRFAAAAEQLRELQLARITRDGAIRYYTLTPTGRRILAALGDTRIGGWL